MAGEAGFSGTDSVVYDNNFRYQVNVNIISSTADATAYSERLTLLTGPDVNRTVSHVETLLRSNGLDAEFRVINNSPPSNQDIISLIDLEGPYLEDISTDWLAAS